MSILAFKCFMRTEKLKKRNPVKNKHVIAIFDYIDLVCLILGWGCNIGVVRNYDCYWGLAIFPKIGKQPVIFLFFEK